MSKIDDIFKDGLDQKGLAYSDAHWAGMEALLDKKKRGFFIRFKWLFLSLLLLLIGFTTYFSWPTFQQNENPNQIALTESNNQRISLNNSLNTQQIASAPIDKNALKASKTNTANNSDSKSATDKKGIFINDHPNKNNNPADGNNNDKSNARKQPPLFPSFTPSTNYSLIKTSSTATNDVGTLSFLKAEKIHLKLRNYILFPYHQDLDRSSCLGMVRIDDNVKFPTKWHLFMAPYIQMSSHNRKINLVTESELKQQEKPLPALGFGINFLAKKGHWVVKSGLQFNQIKEITNYASTFKNQTYDTSFRLVILNFTQTPRGTNVALLETKIDTLIGPSETIINNPDAIVKFNYITLPLAVQYEWHHKRLLYFVEAGGAISLLTNAKGIYTIGDASKTGNLSDNSSSVNKALIQVNGAVGVKYSLTSHVNIWSSYGQNIGLNSMIADYSQKSRTQQFSLGVEIGL